MQLLDTAALSPDDRIRLETRNGEFLFRLLRKEFLGRFPTWLADAVGTEEPLAGPIKFYLIGSDPAADWQDEPSGVVDLSRELFGKIVRGLPTIVVVTEGDHSPTICHALQPTSHVWLNRQPVF